jgi:hypothetical protein
MTPFKRLGLGTNPRRATTGTSSSICLLCRGTKFLCGKPSCPVLMRVGGFMRMKDVLDKSDLQGSSPPGVFVGRYGYPKVFVGPMVPPTVGDTSIMASPESWYHMSISSFVEMMSSLVRGVHPVRVDRIAEAGKFMDDVHDLVLSSSSAYTEVEFSRPIRGRMTFSSEAEPFGPSGPVSDFEVSAGPTNVRVEKAFEDTDLKAVDAMWTLYSSGEPVQVIQRALSAGMLGTEKKRRLVPTRWSITAVDDVLAKRTKETVATYPELGEYRLHHSRSMGNLYAVLLMPGRWSYEMIEVFHKGSIWNTWGDEIAMGGDFEGPEGRTTYAAIGGCYYAGRLAALEHLESIHRNATVVIIREALPSYVLPVGVWTVRQGVRDALTRSPLVLGSLEAAISEVSSMLRGPASAIIRSSRIIRGLKTQTRMTSYF